MLDKAWEFGERLKASRSVATDVWTKKAEGLSYLGDAEGVLAIVKGAGKDKMGKSPYRNPLLNHLAGVAAMQLGREKEARRYWQEALKLSPAFELTIGNLEDLRKPVGERHAPWPFTLDYWLPSRDSGRSSERWVRNEWQGRSGRQGERSGFREGLQAIVARPP